MWDHQPFQTVNRQSYCVIILSYWLLCPHILNYLESIFKNHAVTSHGKNFKSKTNKMSCRSTTQALLQYIHIAKGYKLLHQSLFCQEKKIMLKWKEDFTQMGWHITFRFASIPNCTWASTVSSNLHSGVACKITRKWEKES